MLANYEKDSNRAANRQSDVEKVQRIAAICISEASCQRAMSGEHDFLSE